MHFPKPPSLHEIRARRRPIRNVNVQHEESLSKLERFAVFVADRVGTAGFFVIIIAWTIVWLGWNFLAPDRLRFDPPMSFVFWLFIANVVQIVLMPLIMVAQNLQSRHAEMRADSDYEVNIKAEQEIEALLHHLEYQTAMLQDILSRLPSSDPDQPNGDQA